MKRLANHLLLVFLCITTQTTAQVAEVTYNHEEDIMNQFLTMETGAGALTPAGYYNMFHKSYQKTANATNKLVFRTATVVKMNEEKCPAAKIDSDYVARAKTEALNIESRSKETDVTWAMEKSKVNGKLDVFNRNISRIVSSGGTSDDYKTWKNIYSCIETAIKYIQESYLDLGQRKKEYLAIYRDIVKRNAQLVEKLSYWRSSKKAKEFLDNKTKITRVTSTKVVAQDCLRRWQTAFGVDGASGKK